MLARAQDSGVAGGPVERAVRTAARGRRLALAVSGGRDSMALLHAAARAAHDSVAVVATFDHGTGPAATQAAALVAREATALGFPVVVGHCGQVGSTEAEWRAERLTFLDDVARRAGAVVATAHTRDDQVETVLIRVLRDSGPRGLAGLFAGGTRVRPLLDVSREAVADYARAAGALWVEDPTNASPKFLRNRVRRDLLPALARVAPGFEAEVLGIARAAADWRRRLDDAIALAIRVERLRDGISVAAADLAGFSLEQLAVLWPAIAARAGVLADWRGTERAAGFTIGSRVGARMPLSGGWSMARTQDAFELRRAGAPVLPAGVTLGALTEWDAWVFRTTGEAVSDGGAWVARLPAGPLHVRAWRAGDRMRAGPHGLPRRVKRFLSDAGVSGELRARWPVVVSGDEIVWIPGIRRSDAAATRAGGPGVLIHCELNDR